MANILDRMAGSPWQFIPSTPAQFFVVQLARHLDDLNHMPEYRLLSERYPQHLLLQVFQRTLKRGERDKGLRFLRELPCGICPG